MKNLTPEEKRVIDAFDDNCESHDKNHIFKSNSFYTRVNDSDGTCLCFHDEIDLKKVKSFLLQSLRDQKEMFLRDLEELNPKDGVFKSVSESSEYRDGYNMAKKDSISIVKKH